MEAPYRPYLAEYKYDYWNSSQIKTLCSYRNSSNDLSLTYYAMILRDLCMGSCSRKLLVLQKRAPQLIYFAPSDVHAIYLFIESKMLPVKMIYLTRLRISCMIFGKVQPLRFNIRDLFTRSIEIHRYNTRHATKGNYIRKEVKLEIFKGSFSRTGEMLQNQISQRERSI